jgi:hypothetical protein
VERSVWIYEALRSFASVPDRPGGSLGTGLFSAYLRENDNDANDRKGPASVPVEDAIAWGRANASTVTVVVCDDSGGPAHFSAGDIAPKRWDVGHLLQWPEDGSLLAARRLASEVSLGLPADGGDLSGGRWHVELSVMVSGAALPASFVSAWAAMLATDDAGVEVLSSDATGRPGGLHEPEGSGFWAKLFLGEPLGSLHLLLAPETRDQAESLAVHLGVRAAERHWRRWGFPAQRAKCPAELAPGRSRTELNRNTARPRPDISLGIDDSDRSQSFAGFAGRAVTLGELGLGLGGRPASDVSSGCRFR